MNLIEEKMIECLTRNKNKTLKNTTVTNVSYNLQNNTVNKKYIYLYGNLITVFQESNEGFELCITDAGWKTKTTKSRLNAILDWYDDYQIKNKPLLTNIHYTIYQENYEWYIYALSESFHFDSLKDENGFVQVNYYQFKELDQCKM